MKALFMKIWKNDFYQGGVFLTVSTLIMNVLNYIFNLIVARTLGPTGYGDITSLFSYITIFAAPLTIISTLIIQRISSTEHNKLSYSLSIEKYVWLKIYKFWFIALIPILIVPFLPRITNLSPFTAYALLPLVYLTFMVSFYSAILNGLRFFFYFALIGVLSTFIKLMGIFFEIYGYKIISIEVFLILSFIFSITSVIYLLHRKISVKDNTTTTVTINMEKRLIHIFLSPQFIITSISIISISLFSNLDIIFVKKFFISSHAGIYASWALFAKVILYFIAPFTTLSFVFFSGVKNEMKEKKTLLVSLIMISLFAVCSFIFYSTFAHTLITIVFGNKYTAISPFLGKASIFGSLYTAITVLNNYFLAKKSAFSLILTAILPFYVVGLFLIPKQLENIIDLNIIFSFIIVAVYLIGLLKTYKKTV
jgi:O-antigen/teichoic acid export membrane protein